ncbi:MAG: pyridoxamine 5'-phosphate oxidase [Gemmatimonadales bacterium]
MSDLAALRREYARAALDLSDTNPDPFVQFTRWLDEAREVESREPTGMTLATSDATGRPDARIVLLKGVDASGFVFYTDRRSAKGRQLAEHPLATLCFWWAEVERQVRIAGRVEQTSDAESDAYFRTRPRESQLSAWTSHQSTAVADRATLDAAWVEIEARFEDGEVPRPPHWGGYRVVPSEFEFWQGRPGRFHDRIHYVREPDGSWRRERLSP